MSIVIHRTILLFLLKTFLTYPLNGPKFFYAYLRGCFFLMSNLLSIQCFFLKIIIITIISVIVVIIIFAVVIVSLVLALLPYFHIH